MLPAPHNSNTQPRDTLMTSCVVPTSTFGAFVFGLGMLSIQVVFRATVSTHIRTKQVYFSAQVLWQGQSTDRNTAHWAKPERKAGYEWTWDLLSLVNLLLLLPALSLQLVPTLTRCNGDIQNRGVSTTQRKGWKHRTKPSK